MRTLIHWIKTFTITSHAFWVGALLSSAVGLAFYVITENTLASDASERFHHSVRTVQLTIGGRIKSYVDVLRGAASLFQTSPELTREQFHRYVEGLNLQAEFPGIETINFARHVTDAQRPAFEKAMRAELAVMASGYPPFQITPPGRRDEYMVLTYIEPISAWGNRFGHDVRARPPFSLDKTADEMRDSGNLASSGAPIPLPRGITGIAMRLPIYSTGMPVATVEQRRAAFYGSVGIGFSVERLLQGVLDNLPFHGMRLVLAGLVPVENGAQLRIVLYDSAVPHGKPQAGQPAPDDELTMTVPVDFNQRSWEATFSIGKAQLYSGFDAYVPWLAMLAGVISTALLYALFHTLAMSRRNTLRMAEVMTSELRASQANLQASNENLRRLAAHAESIKEGERKRIAREIHDDLGQNLLALRIEADMLAARTSGRQPRLHARACATLAQIDATIKSVRQIINDLRPNVLDLGLSAAVEWQVSEFRRRTGIACELIDDHRNTGLDDRCATAFFRVLQESLSNIVRHAGASVVRVELKVEANTLSMTITDNGVGLPPGGRGHKASFGLVGIEERISILGGSSAVTSCLGVGTAVHVAVPLHRQAGAALTMTPALAGETGDALA
jgi:signal transduction histidine kinase